jgi:hypothetical protein
MIDDNAAADRLISGSLKRSRSYHAEYGSKTYAEIKRLAAGKPANHKAALACLAEAYWLQSRPARNGNGAAGADMLARLTGTNTKKR